MDRLSWKKALHERGGRAIWERFHSPHPSRCILQKVPCFESRVLDTKSVKQCLLRVMVMLFFLYVLRRNSNYHSACLPFKECSLFLSSTLRVHCVTSGCCLFIACHWYIAIVFSASSLSSCFNSPVIVRARLCPRQHCCVDEGRRGESKGRSLACTAQAKHLGCGRFFADQTLCQVKDKKEKKMRTGTGQQNLAGSPRTLRAFI